MATLDAPSIDSIGACVTLAPLRGFMRSGKAQKKKASLAERLCEILFSGIISIYDGFECEIEELNQGLLVDIFDFFHEQTVAVDRMALEREIFRMFSQEFVDAIAEFFRGSFIGMRLRIKFDIALGAEIHDGIANAAITEIDTADTPAASLNIAAFITGINH